jgi:LDH2 family malate/lactate/ureidoglycolate dehydrogenase
MALPGAQQQREARTARTRLLDHLVGTALEQAGVSQTDAARVLGHAIAGMSYGVYSSGPGLKRLAAVVEEIRYDGLKVPGAR